MLLQEIFAITPETQQRIDEAPYGLGSRTKDNISSFFGSSTAKGNKEAGTLANTWMKEFKEYIGRVVGPGQKTVPAEHLFKFLHSKKIDVNKLGISRQSTITPKQAEEVMMRAARTTFDTLSSPVNKKEAEPKSNSSEEYDDSDIDYSQFEEEDDDLEVSPRVQSLLSMIQQLSDDELQTLAQHLK